MASDLIKKRCVPCEGGVPRLEGAALQALLPEVPGWQPTDDGRKLQKRFRFDYFRAAMRFLNQVAEIAERENHHPDFCLHGYRMVDVTLMTHAIGGLSENDFILAAKIDEVAAAGER